MARANTISGQGITGVSILGYVCPRGNPIKLNITSEDVNHSFFIPAFRVKMDAVAGLETYTWFFADEIGHYEIFCAEYCGEGHADMRGVLKIVSQAEYEQWLAEDCTAWQWCGGADLDRSSKVDFEDFVILAESWGVVEPFISTLFCLTSMSI